MICLIKHRKVIYRFFLIGTALMFLEVFIKHLYLKYVEIDADLEHGIISQKLDLKTLYPITKGKYILNNPELCHLPRVSIIVMVHTSPEHFRNRVEMRRSWLNSTNYYPETVLTVFLLGYVENSTLQNIIVNESKIYQDIVQGNFRDSYRNLTHKGVMGYRWIMEHCRNAEVVVKTDDDSMINFFMFFKYHRNWFIRKKKHLFCHKNIQGENRIIRSQSSKWFVSENQLKGYEFYPHTYCSGFVVFISIDSIPLLHHAASFSPFFWIDDYYLFGILPSKIPDISFTDFGKTFIVYPHLARLCYPFIEKHCPFMFIQFDLEDMNDIWNFITKQQT